MIQTIKTTVPQILEHRYTQSMFYLEINYFFLLEKKVFEKKIIIFIG